ncbi:uncharacterized protein ARMOST_10117 [Armillaria ostoyae]|uniref:Uncharacterized protein n=1 Tax=Armillaria ostoyae TaxID=47428 RepID=A0A284RDJ5_ARMOS|nr:uncharacterized protein ARMOST_10117 [Armillaria ostoyae]
MPTSSGSSVWFLFRELIKEDLWHPDSLAYNNDHTCCANVSIDVLANRLTATQLKTLGRMHGIRILTNLNKTSLIDLIKSYVYETCTKYLTIFDVGYLYKPDPVVSSPVKKQTSASLKADIESVSEPTTTPTLFPPKLLSQDLTRAIIQNFCHNISPDVFMEAGCAIWRWLTPLSDLSSK